MKLDPKYGYAQIGNKIFTLGGQTAATPHPDGGETSAPRAARDRDYFFSRFGWFWDRRGKIFSTPEIYRIYPLFSGLSLAYVGGGPLSLGMLFKLWRSGGWGVECPECGGGALIYFAGGSPLSGTNSWKAHCVFCGAEIEGHAEKFSELWRPAKELIDEEGRKNRPLAVQTSPRAKNPREGFRALSLRWRRDYDEKSEAELEQAARERRERREAEWLLALEIESEKYELSGLTAETLPTEKAEAMLKKLEKTKEDVS